jgi:hypothetical protein
VRDRPRAARDEPAQTSQFAPEIDVDESTSEPERRLSPLVPPRPQGQAESLVEATTTFVRLLRAGGWFDAIWAALLGFLVLIAYGALLVGVVRVADARFGAGRDPSWALSHIVAEALAALGVPLERGETVTSVVPLGVMFVVGCVIAWAARKVVDGGPAVDIRERISAGAKVGLPFGVICTLAALPIWVSKAGDLDLNPIVAAVFGAFWAVLFGGVGGALAGSSARAAARDGIAVMRSRSGFLYEGFAAGANMLAVAGVLAMVGALIIIVIDLGLSADDPVTGGDWLAVAFFLIVLAPNIAVGITGFAVGAPVEFVHVTFGSKFPGEVSLLGIAGDTPDWFYYPLLVIPIVACVLGGYGARRRADEPENATDVVTFAAVAFASALAGLVFVGTADIERALIGRENLLALSPDPWWVLPLAFVWAGLLGWVGWILEEKRLHLGPMGRRSADAPDVSHNGRTA